MSKEIDPVYFTNHVNRKLRPSDDLQGEASVHGLSVASTVQIGTTDAALKIFKLDSTGNIKTSNALVFKGETGAANNLVKVEGGLSVESGSGLFVRSQQGIRVIGDAHSDTLVDITRYTNSERAVVNFIPSGALSAANVRFSIGFDYGSSGFSLLGYDGTTSTEFAKVSAAGLVTIKSGVTISGNTSISGTLTQRGNATFLGNTNISGNSFIAGANNVSGLSTLNTVAVTGDFVASGLVVQNNVSITGTLGVTGLTTLETLVIRGSSTLDGDFGVLGDTVLNTLDVTGAFANVSGSATFNTLNVTGGTFSASGSSTVNTLTATGSSVNFQQNLNVSGVSVLNTLVVSGLSTGLSGSLTQRGSASFLNNVSISGNTTISGNAFVSGIISGSNLLKSTNGNGSLFFNILDGYRNFNPSAYHFVTRPEPDAFGNTPERYSVFSLRKDSSTTNGADDKQVNGLYVGLIPNSGSTSRSELLVAVAAQSIAGSSATTAFNDSGIFSGVSFAALSPKLSSRQAGTTGPIYSVGLLIEAQKTGSVVTSGIGIYQAGVDDVNFFSGTSYLASIDNGIRVTGSSTFFTTLTTSNTLSHSITTTWGLEGTVSEYQGTILNLYNTASSLEPDFPNGQRTTLTGLSVNLAIETGNKNFTNRTVGIYSNSLSSSTEKSNFTSSPYANFTGIALMAGSPNTTQKNDSHEGEIHSFGLFIESQKSTGIIDQGYGIYQAGIDDENYFAGYSTFNEDVEFNKAIVAQTGTFNQLLSGSFLTVRNSSYLSTNPGALFGIGLPFGEVLQAPVDIALGTVFRDNVKISGNVSLALVTDTKVGINTITPISGLSVNTDAVFHSGVTISGSSTVVGTVKTNNFDSYTSNIITSSKNIIFDSNQIINFEQPYGSAYDGQFSELNMDIHKRFYVFPETDLGETYFYSDYPLPPNPPNYPNFWYNKIILPLTPENFEEYFIINKTESFMIDKSGTNIYKFRSLSPGAGHTINSDTLITVGGLFDYTNSHTTVSNVIPSTSRLIKLIFYDNTWYIQ